MRANNFISSGSRAINHYNIIVMHSILPFTRKFFLDAIPMTGTVDSLKMLTQLLISKEVTGLEADMWLTTLAFIQHPTLDMLAEVKPLLSLIDNEEKAMLSVSSLVHSYCKTNTGCDGNLQIRKIISLLENKIGPACKVTDANFKTVRVRSNEKKILNC